MKQAEEWLLNQKELSIYDVAEHDEGGYLGVNEEKLYEIMIEFSKFQNIELQMRVKELERMVDLELLRRMNGIDDEKKLKLNWEEYKSNFLK